ncbi:MAG: 3-isopropylmalate dehydrogenase [Gemmatimonadota bacterium]|uniref:3-isopropylmalate dehydrogenase n=1 Tax=Candidatus Palauibacter scopulicola TaxID=3056741 RepID=UPI002395FDBF|nr:3-isopropylmalate dehydrogenase [Candidatus Palauibacter scopulicola]MDE2662993.1 3-isopropylmalate dehydrogenase [Candidatus Palauibacter scopulicola]
MDGRVLLLPGDGIGPEVLLEARRVLEAVGEVYGHRFDISEAPIGDGALERFGDPLPEEARALAVEVDAVLVGAVGLGVRSVEGTEVDASRGLLDLRRLLGNHANIRPVSVPEALVGRSPLRPERVRGVDLVVVRELLGGIYYGHPRGIADGVAFDTEIYAEEEIRRISASAFELARTRRRKVTSIDKANVLESSLFWRRIAGEVSRDYPDVEFSSMLVDNCAMQLIHNPRQFDVLLTSNMFGDILSDEAAVLVGSLGMLPSASVGGDVGIYEPVHGAAPDIAGRGIANPIGAILSVAMMLELAFALPEEAGAVRAAVNRVLEDGHGTADLHADGGRAAVSTARMGEAIIGALRATGAAGG